MFAALKMKEVRVRTITKQKSGKEKCRERRKETEIRFSRTQRYFDDSLELYNVTVTSSTVCEQQPAVSLYRQ